MHLHLQRSPRPGEDASPGRGDRPGQADARERRDAAGNPFTSPWEVTEMEVVVRSRNIEVTAALKAHVEKKVRKLDKFLSDAGKAQVRTNQEAASSMGC